MSNKYQTTKSSLSTRGWRYVIVSPVKDESPCIEHTIRSVVAQTVLPSTWVIVDDGSRDATPEIVAEYSRVHPWIKLVVIQRDSYRHPACAEIPAFNRGLREANHQYSDFIVKLDGDVAFAPNYFDRLFREFQKDERLGIASGIYFEAKKNGWTSVVMPEYHASGASKVVRQSCFQEIGGFVESLGWDTVDEIRAQVKGWHTRHFKEIEFYHLKPEGSAIGWVRTNMLHGLVNYLTGGSLPFLLMKSGHRLATGKPLVLGAMFMLLGYLSPMMQRRKRLTTPEEMSYYRKLLRRRISRAISNRLGLRLSAKSGNFITQITRS